MQDGLQEQQLWQNQRTVTDPDLIYLPEVPFDIDKFLKKVKELLNKKSSIVIAVSEGIKLADGRYVCELGNVGDYVDAFGHKQLQGTATYAGKFPGSRVRLQNKSRRTFYSSAQCLSYGFQSGH